PEGSKPHSLGVGEPRRVSIQKLVVEHPLERSEIAAAHRRVALVLEVEDFLSAAHRQTPLRFHHALRARARSLAPSLEHLVGDCEHTNSRRLMGLTPSSRITKG